MTHRYLFISTRHRAQALGIALCVLAACAPASAFAAEASAQAVLGAVAEGERAGICTIRQEAASSDCKKNITTCSSSDWQKYISAHYQNQGGSISFGGASGGAAGKNLKDSEVTSELATEAANILKRHLARFPQCQRDSRGCPADMSACGLGTDYPYTSSGGISYIAKVTAHFNRGCGPSGNVGVHWVFGSSGTAATSDATGEALEYLQADWSRNSATAPGPVQRGTCYCQCIPGSGNAACSGKETGTPVRVNENLTRGQCASACGNMPVASNKCQVADIVTGGDGTKSAETSQGAAWCFSPAACAEQGGFYEAGTGNCAASQGRCYAAEPEVELNVALGDVKVVRGFNQYVVTAFRFLISIVGVAATVMFTWGAFLYLLGSAIPSIKSGKGMMIDAVFGLILVLASTMILRAINPATTNLQPIKVYLVNTVQYLHSVSCKDMNLNERLAEAGKRPNLTPHEIVAANPASFTVQPKDAKCGMSYWARDTVGGSACDGSMCPNKGEACVSCAGSEAKTAESCNGKPPTDYACQKTIFAGTIQYADKREPEDVHMLLLCNHAQPANLATADTDDVTNSWKIVDADLVTTAYGSDAQTSDKAVGGQGAYRLTFDQELLDDMETFCESRGGLRGALLGVEYNDDLIPPSTRALGSAALLVAGSIVFPVASPLALAAVVAIGYSMPADDFAIVSKQNCGGSQNPFDAYSKGTDLSRDSTDIARGVLCGFARNKLLNGTGAYWTRDELARAISGDAPITCNVSLTRNTAPSDPELCAEKNE
jgi:hypothetical protein